ncbi:MAG: PH domain-containing protein [Oscillochloridaceae bacterium umkhey_bin13]
MAPQAPEERVALSDRLRKQIGLDPAETVELGPDEKIIFATGRHYIVLLGTSIFPVLMIIFFAGLTFYRAIGGGFLAQNTGISGEFDLFNWVLVSLAAIFSLIVALLWVRGRKTATARTILGIIILALATLAFFRYDGGQVFVLDSSRAPAQRFDLVNLFLMFMTGFSAWLLLLVSYDWLNDELIVTNQRVVFDNDQVVIPRLIERKIQQTILIEDVQNVSFMTETYPQHWLGYGTIKIVSARINGNIVFQSAKNPQRTQAAIMSQVQALRKSQSNKNYERLIADHIYGQKSPEPRPQISIQQTQAMRWLRSVLPDNPEVNQTNGEIIWRQHWLFLARGLLGPLTLLLAGGLIVLLAGGIFVISLPLLILWGILLGIAVVGWTLWEIEDYRNDKYILSPDKLIDIEKKPFGPEKRRDAGLAAINNVNFRTTFISNLLGYGDVVLTTAGSGGEFTFLRVPRPRDVVNTIIQYNVRAKRQGETRVFNDTLTLLRYYHEAQLERNEINRPPS